MAGGGLMPTTRGATITVVQDSQEFLYDDGTYETRATMAASARTVSGTNIINESGSNTATFTSLSHNGSEYYDWESYGEGHSNRSVPDASRVEHSIGGGVSTGHEILQVDGDTIYENSYYYNEHYALLYGPDDALIHSVLVQTSRSVIDGDLSVGHIILVENTNGYNWLRINDAGVNHESIYGNHDGLL